MIKIADRIFNLSDDREFNETALEIFHVQYNGNKIYRQFADALGTDASSIAHFSQVPFLPVSFFKTHTVYCGTTAPQKTFLSSGTTGMERSRHEVREVSIYRQSLRFAWEKFYGPIAEWEIFGLMPAPDENPDSSLIFMVDEWVKLSSSAISGFYRDRMNLLSEILEKNNSTGRKRLVIGLSYALLDFADEYQSEYPEVVFMETGGMKGKRREMVREELHALLKESFAATAIHSEYGMTELLSQAYSGGNGRFHSPPWMKVIARDPNDPVKLFPHDKTGCLNIIDLANLHSCSFIATEDLGRTHEDGSFEVLGRFDPSDVRGCNLMIE
jgi:hypothetical protein